MFGNLFSSHKEVMDQEGWHGRAKRNRDEAGVLTSDEDAYGTGAAAAGGKRKANRLEDDSGLGSGWDTGAMEEEDQQQEVMRGSRGRASQQGEATEGREGAAGGGMMEVNLEGEDMEEGGEGQAAFTMMMTARQEIEEAASDEPEDEDEEEEVTEKEVTATLLEAVEAIKRAREEARSGDAAGVGAQGMLAPPAGVGAYVDRVLRGFRGVLTSTRPTAQLQDLIEALARVQEGRLEPSARQIASELHKVQEACVIRLPYKHGALLRAAQASMQSTAGGAKAASAAAAAAVPGSVAEGTKKPDEVFDAQIEACIDLLDQLQAVDEAAQRLEGYKEEYVGRGQALVADKDSWVKTWQAKLVDHTTDAERAKKVLLELDQQFDQLVKDPVVLTATATATGASPSASASLALVSKLLDIVRMEENKEQVERRQEAAAQLAAREAARARVGTNLRLVEGFVALMRVVVEGGKARVGREVAAFEEEMATIRNQLRAQLRQEVEAAAAKLQAVLEFHEARKTRASKSAKLREHELRQHTSLFGQDTPTETQRLESCVKELRRVVSHSQMAIDKALQQQQAFWTRAETQLSRELAQELAQAYKEKMVRAPGVAGGHSMLPPPYASQAQASFELTQAGGHMLSSPGTRSKRHESALAMAVAEGAAQEEDELRRGTSEGPAVKQSPLKKDDACAIM